MFCLSMVLMAHMAVTTMRWCGSWCLTRSFWNVSKKAGGGRGGKGICHQCMADTGNYAWENFEDEVPPWVDSIPISTSPFGRPPALLRLEHSRNDPSTFFSWDLFHGWHLGTSKVFLGSCIAIAILSDIFEGTMDQRFAAVNEHFKAFCVQNKLKPHLRKITKEKLSCPATTQYPTGVWSKGSTATCLMSWFRSLCDANPKVVVADPLFHLVYHAAVSMDECLRGLYSWELWIPPEEGLALANKGLQFLRLNGRAAVLAHQQSRKVLKHMPNLHRLHHIMWELKCQGAANKYCANPLFLSCQTDEDFIGRPSRVSRRVSARLTIQRTLQRSLIVGLEHYVKAGLIVPDSAR